ncbi:MAG: sensor histidine kinase [bacterium]|nr:sensor histidine kinase [bacterium]
MRKRSRPPFGIFTKLAVLYIGVGLLPLMFIARFFFQEFSENTKNILLNDAATILQSAGGYVDTMLTEWENETVSLYSLQVEEGQYLDDILLDKKMSQEEKNSTIRRYLSKFSQITGLKSIRFLEADGTLHCVSEVVGKIINQENMKHWITKETRKGREERQITLSPIHHDSYFLNINDDVITVRRNLYDVSSSTTIDHYLGSIYLDISKDVISHQLYEIKLGSKSGLYIIDQDGEQIYKNENQSELSAEIKKDILYNVNTGENQYIEDKDSYYLYQKNSQGGWVSLIRIHKDDIIENMNTTEKYVMTVLFVSMVILLSIYLFFSDQLSVSIRTLKMGMERIQKGELDTRVEITRKDEIGVLAEGLNQMASQLSTYIERVYGAEIKQREAELNALRSQINPHYLYNTLDIIRMTAVTNDDRQTAEMIESLARQLRYLMGKEADLVPLERELENISDYFTVVRTRYEGRIELKMTIPDKLKQVQILKLVLQPIVENAVKHGLKEKAGRGTVWISAKHLDNMLELMVMDDGVGMSEETLLRLNNGLTKGVGISNVRDRIEKNYGPNYGMEIHSTLGEGTIVILHIPYSEKGSQDAESTIN